MRLRSRLSNNILTLIDRRGPHHFMLSDIVRLEATSSYTVLYIKGKHPFTIAKVLKEYEELLSAHGFVRTHRSHLVNKHLINRIEHRTIIMEDNSSAVIARNKKAAVIKCLKQHLVA